MTTTWRDQAACQGADLAVFFPTQRNGRPLDYREAARYCAICPCREPCAEDTFQADRTFGAHGFQAGMTPESRAQVRRR